MKEPSLYIRADAHPGIGIGHLMRCIALGQAWRRAVGDVMFISRCENESLRRRISDEGFSLVPIGSSCPDPSDIRRTLDAVFSNDTLPPGTPRWLVIDGYHFDPEYQAAARGSGLRVLLIDDMAHLPVYHADILLNQNLRAGSLDYRADPDTVFLLGPEFALLRSEFLTLEKNRRKTTPGPHRVLVTLGGADPGNITLKAVRALKGLPVPGLDVKVVIGPENPDPGLILAEVTADFSQGAPEASARVALVRDGDMPRLMAWADAAVCAGGSTCWELAYAGVPAVIVIMDENQRANAEDLDRCGAARNCGWAASVPPGDISSVLLDILCDGDLRSRMIRKGMRLVDGRGARRVVRAMIGETDA